MRDPVNVAKQKQWCYLSLSHSHSPQVNVPLPEQCGLDSSYKKYITWQWCSRINRYFVMRSIIIAVLLFSTLLYKSTDTRLRTPGWQNTQGEGRVTRNQARIQGRWNGWIFTPHFLSPLLSFFFLFLKYWLVLIHYYKNSPPISKSWIRAGEWTNIPSRGDVQLSSSF